MQILGVAGSCIAFTRSSWHQGLLDYDMLIVGKNVHLAEPEFSDLSDLADALAVPFVTSILESSYDGIFNLLGIELPSATSWCFQDVDAESNQEQFYRPKILINASRLQQI